MEVYDESDPDWTLVGSNGEFGFAPSNYIDKPGVQSNGTSRYAVADNAYDEHESGFTSPSESPMQSPAAALAGLIHQRTGQSMAAMATSPPRASTYTPDASDDEAAPPPSLPRRPQIASLASYDKALPRPPREASSPVYENSSASGFRMYHIHEMISHMGRNRKMPTVFGVNVAKEC